MLEDCVWVKEDRPSAASGAYCKYFLILCVPQTTPSIAQRLLVTLDQNCHDAGEQAFWTISNLVSKLILWLCFYWQHKRELNRWSLCCGIRKGNFVKVVLSMVTYIKRDYRLFLLLLKDLQIWE